MNKCTISSNTMLNWKHCFQNRRLNLTFSLKNVHYLGTFSSPTLPQPNNFSHHRSQRFYNFHFVVLFQSFPIFTDVDDFDMMH
jgi:hypothetical protein